MKTHGLLLDRVYRTGKMTFYFLPFTFLIAMFNTTNCLGKAVEIYFVDKLTNAQGKEMGGIQSNLGIVITSLIKNGQAIAHEILHNCGTEDIYTVQDPFSPDYGSLEVPIREAWLPNDWGGGYYAPGLMQEDLIARLIMRSGVPDLDALGLVLPRGTIYGWRHAGNAASPIELGQAGVGQNSCTKTPGSY